MALVILLFFTQCVITMIVIFALKRLWDKELICAALEEFETCVPSPDIKSINVRTACAISEAFKSEIESIRRRKFVQAGLNIQVDPGLKGGIVITVGGLSLDFSFS